MNSYEFDIRAFNASTWHLDRLERSVYRDLLDLYYEIGGPLPSSVEWICERLAARSDEEIAAIGRVLSEFFVEQDGWRNERCEAEIVKARLRGA